MCSVDPFKLKCRFNTCKFKSVTFSTKALFDPSYSENDQVALDFVINIMFSSFLNLQSDKNTSPIS